LAWLGGFGPVAKVGIEGTSSYGSGLARSLRRGGVEVVEVDRPNRRMSADNRTRAYVERRLAEGKTKPDIVRIPKRYLCGAREYAAPSRGSQRCRCLKA
jgi:transposase